MFISKMTLSQSGVFGQFDDLQDLASAEEIEKLTVDEDLNDIERAVYLLSSGQDVQRASVIVNLPNLVRQNPAETFRRVVPKVREVLHVAGADMQLAAAGSFLTVLQDDIVLIQTHTHSILQIVLLNLDHRDSVVSSAWLETLLSAIDALPKETIRQEILGPLVSKAQLSQTVQSRLASCRILGKVAAKFESSAVKKDLVPMVRSLCQDVEYEVRSCIPEHLKAVVLPELVELARDEGSTVRLAAFDTIINLLEMFDNDDRTHVIFPLVKTFCEKCFKADEAVLASLSFQYGKLCHGLSASFTEEQHLWFLEFYKKLCCLGLQNENGHCESQGYTLELENKYALVRRNCAFNFPAMVLFADPNHFLSELYRTFSSLCHDPEISVRRTTAEGFHEVLDSLLTHLQETLELATSRGEGAGPENKVNVPDLVPALVAAEQKAAASLRWRVHEKLLQRYSCLPRVVSGDHIYFRFLQRIFSIITTNIFVFDFFIGMNVDDVVEELAQGRSYWSRLRYLDLCDIAIDLFSKSYFCKHFLPQALELITDPVANVRYKLCYMLPRLRSTIRLPVEKHLLQQLEFGVRKLLCREKDKDVLATVRMELLERQQNEAKLAGEKHGEKKRRDSKAGLSTTKGMTGSTSGATLSSAGKEMRRSKLARSRSLSSHPSTSKMSNSDKALKVKESGSCPGSGKSSIIAINDDALRPHHFVASTSASLSQTPSTSSMPVLIRSNTSSSVEHRSNSSSSSKDTQSRKLSMYGQKYTRYNNMTSGLKRDSGVNRRHAKSGCGQWLWKSMWVWSEVVEKYVGVVRGCGKVCGCGQRFCGRVCGCWSVWSEVVQEYVGCGQRLCRSMWGVVQRLWKGIYVGFVCSQWLWKSMWVWSEVVQEYVGVVRGCAGVCGCGQRLWKRMYVWLEVVQECVGVVNGCAGVPMYYYDWGDNIVPYFTVIPCCFLDKGSPTRSACSLEGSEVPLR
ncbi:Serine/threonine-protein phosphatase 4 regulatory subunit 4 [Bagarius yarrelli]|uniref:Serine/threonine-protein phosphatase 4 regulatory subunit 4 n=1 Tax=Bagarius yarrelli TaxID=175774 RepID=A0A556V1Z9_BAGYA|nr:Serine/threonine-protein phosphatase 4 regulatory subunit 4 [Bagarius yarrelli]